jgi:hypothetical protein
MKERTKETEQNISMKSKRKQNTVYISDKHRRVEYRLSCVYLKKVWARRRMYRLLSWGVYSKLF